MDTIHTLPTRPARRFLNMESLLEYCRDTFDLPISRVTIYREQRKGNLHPIKRGGRLLFSIAEVDAWLTGDAQAEPDVEG
ncbi:hypothetical protein BIU88_09370 [Chlorobaculum limnaeum]|uniref:Helix-turn-helix domain-containing protein n=1 Tax=Chlorobaculum limnaeum TaxID=274537 RepID=A0A1D8D958_CHLLM|nr:helix-turn-helix domain-containing protein [Chlorobaculum limnaeum]AOS84319.1 hypothetical protein BIU88_09370 [Chlorobaculum limnaeum]